jgi:hypothetical protein
MQSAAVRPLAERRFAPDRRPPRIDQPMQDQLQRGPVADNLNAWQSDRQPGLEHVAFN